MILYCIGIVAVLLCVLHILLNYNSRARLIAKIPSPKSVFIVGHALDIMRPSVEIWKFSRKYAKTWKGIYGFWSYPFGAVNIYNPADAEIILSSIKNNEKSDFYSFLKPWLGDGLLLSTGAKWYQRRKILTPTFHFNILKQFLVILDENSQKVVQKLESALEEPVDVMPLVSEFTLNSICETAMGTTLNNEAFKYARTYKDAIYKIREVVIERFSKLYLHSDFIYNFTSLKKKQDCHINTIHGFTKKVINDRKAMAIKINKQISEPNEDISINTKTKTAMLDLLIAAEKDGEIDSKGIQEEVDTFMFAGQDTTASGLTFCLMLLANHKSIQDNIITELNEIFVDDERRPNMEDFTKMRYLERCIKESLRLFPPIPFISRKLSETVILSNYTVPAGTYCHVQIYDMHRSADIYENPDAFDPDRFLPENSVRRHPYAYVPFSAGYRNCIGQKFAIMEIKSVVSSILRKYRLLPVTKVSDIEMSGDFVLRNNEPVLVKFVRRINT